MRTVYMGLQPFRNPTHFGSKVPSLPRNGTVLVLPNVTPSGMVLHTLPRFLRQRNYVLAAVGSERDKQFTLHHTILQNNTPVFFHTTPLEKVYQECPKALVKYNFPLVLAHTAHTSA